MRRPNSDSAPSAPPAPAEGRPGPAPDLDQAPPGNPPAVPVLHPRAVYDLAGAARALGLARSCLPREIRLGRLRAAKRAGKVLILGKWLLAWIEGGEISRARGEASPAGGRLP